MQWLDHAFYGIPLDDWLTAAAVAVGLAILLVITKAFLVRRLGAMAAKTTTPWDDVLVALLAQTKNAFLLLLAVYFASLSLPLPDRSARVIDAAAILAFLFQIAFWGGEGIRLLQGRYLATAHTADSTRHASIHAVAFIGRLVMWSVILLLVLENLGINVTALVAGLGVTGVAVALAVQNILGDLFASLSIMLDKPFAVGDFITVDDYLGTVEYIGLKTTRLRSLFGEQIVFSNTDLLKSRIRNYKRMQERRISFAFSLTYENPPGNLERAPGVVREVINAQKSARFDRCHFKNFRDFALDFEVVYYVTSPEYRLYMDTQQAINLGVFGRFHELGIEFAHVPTAHTQPLPQAQSRERSA